MSGSPADAVVERIDRVLARVAAGGGDGRGDIHVRGLCGEAFGWLGVHARAEAIFAPLTQESWAITGPDRVYRLSVLAGERSRYGNIAAALDAANEAAKFPLPEHDLEERARLANQMASAFEAARELGRARELATISCEAMLRVQESGSFFHLRNIAEMLVQLDDHAAAARLLDHALSKGPVSDIWDICSFGQIEARIGRIDDAWARVPTLLHEPTALASLVSVLADCALDRTSALRDLIAQVSDTAQRADLLLCAADGLVEHAEHISAAIELTEEALARVAGLPALRRWDVVSSAAEVYRMAGASARHAALAREALVCMDPANSFQVGETASGLAQAGDVLAALGVFDAWVAVPLPENDEYWTEALMVRDIAYTFPRPPGAKPFFTPPTTA